MLKFYRYNEDKFTKWVVEKLEEMVVAHKLINVEENTSLPRKIQKEDLPVLSDGHKHWTAEKEIKEFLEELHQDLLLSQSLQSDACHLDPDNPEECL